MKAALVKNGTELVVTHGRYTGYRGFIVRRYNRGTNLETVRVNLEGVGPRTLATGWVQIYQK